MARRDTNRREDGGEAADTIVAIATPAGRGGIGVARLSGPRALAIARALVGEAETAADWPPGQARRRRFIAEDRDHAALDDVLVTYFRAPRSYTAEDVVEISGHGSPVLLAAMVEAARRRGARLAEPGEFTRRAFLNGRLDLTQAEAVRDLIAAQTLGQARAAARQLHGSAARALAPLTDATRRLVARLEAGIDFAEDDVTVVADDEIAAALDALATQAAAALAGFRRGRVLREGLALAVVGRPNVGKSSLFNRLLGRERAIVTAAPGTTRDLVSETLELDGAPVRLVDTAGIRAADSEAEQIGITRAWQAAADADLVLAVCDASAGAATRDEADAEADLLARLAELPNVIWALNKCDLTPRGDLAALRTRILAAHLETPKAAPAPPAGAPTEAQAGAPVGAAASEPEVLSVSALRGDGLAELRAALVRRALPDLAEGGDFLTNARHAERLEGFAAAVARARAALGLMPHEALLVDLHQALEELGAITGRTTSEDILGLIFSTFCIGK